MLGSLAILGMPPFGVFTSEFLMITTAIREHPWTAPFLLVGLGVAFAAIFSRVQSMVFGESGAPLSSKNEALRLPVAAATPAMVPAFLHLAMVLVLGLYIPPVLAEWFRAAARLIG
jgi:hydrogenase-4 component F